MALARGQRIPVPGGSIILRHILAIVMPQTQRKLGQAVALRGGTAITGAGQLAVGRRTIIAVVQNALHVLRRRVILLGGAAVPLQRQ